MMHMLRPRLLPLTIFVLALLLVVKSSVLVGAIIGAGEAMGSSVLPAARAAGQPASGLPTSGKAVAGKDAGGSGAGTASSKEKLPVNAGQDAACASTPATAGSSPPDPPVSDSERAVLLDLRQRRQQLEAREAALTTREAVLTAAERKVSGRVDELQALQKKLEALEAARVQREESGWKGLVKLYETMKPRDAAVILNDLDMQVLLQVLDRMKEAKAALILSAMHPERAREVTDGLARMRVENLTSAAGAK